MSFSPDIRATGNFNRQFSKDKRRIAINEIPKSDIDSLQAHVNDLRTYVHSADMKNTLYNFDFPSGSFDPIFEPDFSTVKLRAVFKDVNGLGNVQLQTLSGIDYYSSELADVAASTSTLWYCIPSVNPLTGGLLTRSDTLNRFWRWKVDVHPPQLKFANSIDLNDADKNIANCFLSVQSTGTNFNFSATNFSMGFWIYPRTLPAAGEKKILAYRFIDSSNKWYIELHDDDKLTAQVKVAGVTTKAQYDTPITANNWYFLCLVWNTSGPTVTFKVNDNASIASTKATNTTNTTANLYFGSYPLALTTQDFDGYLTGLTYYNATALSSTEMTRLYNYNTKTSTVKPQSWDYPFS